MSEASIREDVLRIREPGAEWLSTGWDGGFSRADAAYNVSVPEGWDRRDVGAYVETRRRRADFSEPGPALLTGVDLSHARGARSGDVAVYATAGLSNPAALPMVPGGSEEPTAEEGGPVGTVNLVATTARRLDHAGMTNLLAVVAEAKAATLLDVSGFPGTTTDAVVVGSDPEGDPARFTGSATPVGADARACVREAVRASFGSRYADGGVPDTVAEADHGVTTDRRAEVFRP